MPHNYFTNGNFDEMRTGWLQSLRHDAIWRHLNNTTTTTKTKTRIIRLFHFHLWLKQILSAMVNVESFISFCFFHCSVNSNSKNSTQEKHDRWDYISSIHTFILFYFFLLPFFGSYVYSFCLYPSVYLHKAVVSCTQFEWNVIFDALFNKCTSTEFIKENGQITKYYIQNIYTQIQALMCCIYLYNIVGYIDCWISFCTPYLDTCRVYSLYVQLLCNIYI